MKPGLIGQSDPGGRPAPSRMEAPLRRRLICAIGLTGSLCVAGCGQEPGGSVDDAAASSVAANNPVATDLGGSDRAQPTPLTKVYVGRPRGTRVPAGAPTTDPGQVADAAVPAVDPLPASHDSGTPKPTDLPNDVFVETETDAPADANQRWRPRSPGPGSGSGSGGIGGSGGGGGGEGGGGTAPPRTNVPAPDQAAIEPDDPRLKLDGANGVFGRVVGEVIVLGGVDAAVWARGASVQVLYGQPVASGMAVAPRDNASLLDLQPYLGGAVFSQIPAEFRGTTSNFIVLRATPGDVSLRMLSKAQNRNDPHRQIVAWDTVVQDRYDPTLLHD